MAVLGTMLDQPATPDSTDLFPWGSAGHLLPKFGRSGQRPRGARAAVLKRTPELGVQRAKTEPRADVAHRNHQRRKTKPIRCGRRVSSTSLLVDPHSELGR